MLKLLAKLWRDEKGVVTLEYLILCTLLGLVLIMGVTGLAKAFTGELLELGNAILGLNQSYSVSGVSSCNYSSGASGADDLAGNLTLSLIPVQVVNPTIDVIVCP